MKSLKKQMSKKNAFSSRKNKKTKKNVKNKSRKNKINNTWNVEQRTNLNDYVYNNFNTIKSFRKLNATSWEIERTKADDSYNRGHVGCMILSMSKRIMNEVM